MSKKNQIEVIENPNHSPEEMRNLLKEFQALKEKISKLPKAEIKELKAELGRRIISGKLIELREKLIPIIKEYREALKEEFKKTETSEKPNGNKSISLKADIFGIAIIKPAEKK